MIELEREEKKEGMKVREMHRTACNGMKKLKKENQTISRTLKNDTLSALEEDNE